MRALQRIASACLCIPLVAALTPATALAAVGDLSSSNGATEVVGSHIWNIDYADVAKQVIRVKCGVHGEEATNQVTLTISGKVSASEIKARLDEKSAELRKIEVFNPYKLWTTLQLEGDVELEIDADLAVDYFKSASDKACSLTVAGSNDRDLRVDEGGMQLSGDFAMKSGHVVLKNGSGAALHTEGTCTLEGGVLEATGDVYGIAAEGDLTIASPANVTAKAGTGHRYCAAIRGLRSITISGGEVSATESVLGICASNALSVTGGNVEAGTDTSSDAGAFARGSIAIGPNVEVAEPENGEVVSASAFAGEHGVEALGWAIGSASKAAPKVKLAAKKVEGLSEGDATSGGGTTSGGDGASSDNQVGDNQAGNSQTGGNQTGDSQTGGNQGDDAAGTTAGGTGADGASEGSKNAADQGSTAGGETGTTSTGATGAADSDDSTGSTEAGGAGNQTSGSGTSESASGAGNSGTDGAAGAGAAGAGGSSIEAAAAASGVPTGEADSSGSTFRKLRARATKVTRNTVVVKWKKQAGATQYEVWGTRCGKGNRYEFLELAAGKTYTHRGLKAGKYYRYYIVARSANGEILAKSKTIHVATAGGKYTNYKNVKLDAKKLYLRQGSTAFLSPIVAKKDSGKKVSVHKGIRYESSNKKVAKISKKGKVTARGTSGQSCYLYAYAQNGVFARAKVFIA